MKNQIKTILFIAGGYFSYEVVMTLLYLLVLPIFLASLMADEGLQDTICTVVLLVIYSIWYYLLSKKKNSEMPKLVKISPQNALWKNILWVTVIAFGVSSVSNLWMILVEKVLVKIPFIGASYQTMQKAFEGAASGNVIFALLSLVVIGPIVEELLFRGILYKYFQKLSQKPWIAICGTALLFGVWHGIFVQSVYTAFAGLVMAIVFYQTNNILYPMAIHIINNLISYLADLRGISLVLDIIGYLAIIPMILCLVMNYKKKKNDLIRKE